MDAKRTEAVPMKSEYQTGRHGMFSRMTDSSSHTMSTDRSVVDRQEVSRLQAPRVMFLVVLKIDLFKYSRYLLGPYSVGEMNTFSTPQPPAKIATKTINIISQGNNPKDTFMKVHARCL